MAAPISYNYRKGLIFILAFLLVRISDGRTVPSVVDAETIDSAENIGPGDLVNEDSITYNAIATELDRDVNARCVLCKFFVQKIVNALESSRIAGTIDRVIDSACRSIINTTVCDYLSIQITKYIETLIKNDLQPDQACVTANFCPHESYIDSFEDIINTRELRSPIGCKLCTYFINKLDRFVDIYAKRIENNVYPYCDSLPPQTGKECQEAIPMLMDGLIARFISVQTICDDSIHACP